MSTATTAQSAATRSTGVTAPTPQAGPGRDPATGPSMVRLTIVELRKMVDTRSGAWLLVIVGLIAAAMVALQLFTGQDSGRALGPIFGGTLAAAGLLLPVVGILSVTAEWSQRTALTTYALVPRRGRTAFAKLLAGAVLAALSVVACLAFAALGNLLVGPLIDGRGSWEFELSLLGTAFVYQLIGILIGMAFAMLVMNSALAIVLNFLLPIVWGILAALVGALATAQGWLDMSITLTPLTTGEMDGEAWAKVAATAGVWVVLPLACGLVRLLRREVN